MNSLDTNTTSSNQPKLPKVNRLPWVNLGLTRELSDQDLKRLSPNTLAYIGDAIYELYIRSYYLWPPKSSQLYHELVVSQVRAETQSSHLIILKPYLTLAELELVRQGRNVNIKKPKRLDPKIYQEATSFETLIGYLYLTDPSRLIELLNLIYEQTLSSSSTQTNQTEKNHQPPQS